MSKFAKTIIPPSTFSPLRTTTPTRTHEGGSGYARDAKSELFLLAVSNMVGEGTFYESADERDARFRDLIRVVGREDPAWLHSFVPYLRTEMHMRSASLVVAAEYVNAGGPNGRGLVDAALKRADEPAEILAYWSQLYGRAFPKPLKRGVADAVRRLYTERSALKYDSAGSAWRMADVLDLVHPQPVAPWQSALFRYLLNRRHRHDEAVDAELLPVIGASQRLDAIPIEGRRAALLAMTGSHLENTGMTWERLSGWLQGPMDAAAWSRMIPSMGYMALLRNLRNVEEAGVDGATLDAVARRLADPEEVRRSQQFPIRFYSAYKNLASERFTFPLQQAVEIAVENIPQLPGRTLVMVDVSASMRGAISDRSTVARWEIAALFGAALAKRCEAADCFLYNLGPMKMPTAGSVLRTVASVGVLAGGGTRTWSSVGQAYTGHDRIVILTDEQSYDDPSLIAHITCPVYTFNLAGYAPAHMQQGERGRYVFGGLSDAGFSLIPILERYRSVGWPWEQA